MKYKSEKESKIIQSLIEDSVISSFDEIEITEALLEEYSRRYNKFFGKKNFMFTEKQTKFFKRMAALTFTRLNESRSFTLTKISNSKNNQKSGFLYLISNPVYPGYYKIGITKNIEKRLASYQTYDPLKRFKIEHYTFCDNVREEEKRIISLFSVDIKTGEWLKANKALDIFKNVKSMI